MTDQLLLKTEQLQRYVFERSKQTTSRIPERLSGSLDLNYSLFRSNVSVGKKCFRVNCCKGILEGTELGATNAIFPLIATFIDRTTEYSGKANLTAVYAL